MKRKKISQYISHKIYLSKDDLSKDKYYLSKTGFIAILTYLHTLEIHYFFIIMYLITFFFLNTCKHYTYTFITLQMTVITYFKHLL